MSIAYSISDLPGCAGASLQTTQGSVDRPLCAGMAAFASYARGNPLRGMLSGASTYAVIDAAEQFMAEHDIGETRMLLWLRAIDGEKWLHKIDPNLTDPDRGPIVLDPYQLNAISSLSCAGGLVGLFCGAGKTAIAIACARALRTRTWVFCPRNAEGTWEKWRPYIEAMVPGIEYRVVSIDSVHLFTALSGEAGGLMIVDEAHKAGIVAAPKHEPTKSGRARRTGRTAALHIVRPKFDVCLCLTGSTTTSGVEKTLSMKDLAVPGLAGFSSKWKAGAHWGCLVKKNIGSRTVTALAEPTARKTQFMDWLGYQSTLLQPRGESVRAAFQLPEQDIQEIRFNEPWESIPEATARVFHEMIAEKPLEPGEAPPHAKAVAHRLAREGAGEKIEWLMEQLSGTEDQLAIAAMYTETLYKADMALAGAGVTRVLVDGDVVGSERGGCEKAFQFGGVRVFLGQISAASVSMNLQCAKYSVTLDVSGSPIDYEQWLARTCRRGQTERCLHLDLVANRLQHALLARVRSGAVFNAECAEYIEIKNTLKGLIP